MIKILITGGAGFIGNAILSNPKFSKFNIKVIDRFFFGEEIIKKFKKVQFIKNDIRELKVTDFKDIDIVFDLAALSNDPTCELDKKLTNEINFKGRINCAINAKKAGVKKYIFMSSCSVYGKNNLKNLNELSKTDPVSAYAKACLKAEKEIEKISDKKFSLTILRNATVFGYSDRMRFDLVVNLMTASSFYEKKIYILGGGQQIRPLICVDDITEYLYKISVSKNNKYKNQIFNIGRENLKVIDIAKIVKKTLNNNTKLIIVPDDDDKRNYHIDFSKAEKIFNFKPKISVEFAVKQIYSKLSSGSLSKDLKTSTINWYKHLIESKKLIDQVQLKGKIF